MFDLISQLWSYSHLWTITNIIILTLGTFFMMIAYFLALLSLDAIGTAQSCGDVYSFQEDKREAKDASVETGLYFLIITFVILLINGVFLTSKELPIDIYHQLIIYCLPHIAGLLADLGILLLIVLYLLIRIAPKKINWLREQCLKAN